jgi:hypothetical protein
MTLATYAELDDAIDRWLDRTDRTTEIQEWIRLVEFEVGRKLGLRSQELSTTGTLTGGTNIVETPAGILSPKLLVFESSPPVVVDVVTLAQGEEAQFAESGLATPTKATVWGVSAAFKTQILVWPTPPGDVAYTLYYETGITALTAAAPTNYLLLIAADLYLYGALFHAAMFDKDTDGAATWRPVFDEQIRSVKRIEARARAKAGRSHMRAPARYMTP